MDVGVVERKHLRFEAGLPCFPQDYPDAIAAYRTWAQERVADAAAIEAALPPRQRRSHVAAESLSGPTPVAPTSVSNISGVPAWPRIVPTESAQDSSLPLHVLRGSDAATQVCMLNALLFGGGSESNGEAAGRSLKRRRRRRRRKARLLAAEADEEGGPAGGTARLLLDTEAMSSTASAEPVASELLQLLAVQVQPLGRSPEKVFSRGAAELCMPTESDVTEWRRYGNGGHAKNSSEQWPGVLVDLPSPKTVPRAGSESHADRVGDPVVATVRQPIGFITNGGYSWERGRPSGVGYASVSRLRELFSKDTMVGLCHTPPTAAVRSVETSHA